MDERLCAPLSHVISVTRRSARHLPRDTVGLIRDRAVRNEVRLTGNGKWAMVNYIHRIKVVFLLHFTF